MEEKRTLRILFIGNSHTYFNDMPAMVAEKARKAGFDCEVTMIAHGGWYLEQWIREAKSKPVIYMTWARKEEQEVQPRMTAANKQIAEEIGALLAPVGENWWSYREAHPETEMYYEDGAHASAEGSAFAADYIWKSIEEDLK